MRASPCAAGPERGCCGRPGPSWDGARAARKSDATKPVRLGLWPTSEHILVVGISLQQFLELGEGGVRRQRARRRFGPRSPSRCRPARRSAWQRFSGLETMRSNCSFIASEDMRQLQAVALAILVERALAVEHRIGALYAGAGMTQDVEIHG